MASSTALNDQIPTDPIALIVAILASVLLSRHLTQEEASSFALVFPPLLGALPGVRRK